MPTLEEIADLHRDGRRQREIGDALGLSRSRVSNLARIAARALPHWLEWVEKGQLRYKHLEAIIALPSARAEQLLRETMAYGWPAHRLREEVKVAKGLRRPGEAHQDPNVAQLERDLSELLATRVQLVTRPDGTGDLVLGFTDPETLDGLLDRLGYRP